MNDRLKVAVIMGSVRAGRFCDTVTRWVLAQLAGRDAFTVDLIDPAALVPRRRQAKESAALGTLQQRVGAADAFIIVTPEYNHGYPAALKSLIDSVSGEWQAKPVAFVSYGGISGGLRAVEQLRLVFAELHTVTIRNSVSFANAWSQFDDAGQPIQRPAAEAAMTQLMAQLNWWANALRNARSAVQYGKEAA